MGLDPFGGTVSFDVRKFYASIACVLYSVDKRSSSTVNVAAVRYIVLL